MKQIKLTQGKVAMVDDSDFEFLNQWKWFAHNPYDNLWYARRNITLDGKQRAVFMHRQILSVKDKNIFVDHKDHDGLNNQRDNIRACDYSQNNKNAKSHRGSSSKYRGVNFNKLSQKWIARIVIAGKQKSLGYFINEVEAAKAYDHAAKNNYGEFSNLNFPA